MNSAQVIAKILNAAPRDTFDQCLLVFAAIGLVSVTAFLVVLAISDKREGTLSHLVRNEKRKMFGYGFYYPSSLFFRDIYDPSGKSLAVIVLFVLLAWAAISRLQPSGGPSDVESSLIARLQTLDAGIALVFVPFTIFAIGLSSRRTESAINMAEVLLKETFIFPITVVVLSLLTSFILVRRPIVGEIAVLITLSCAIFAIFRLCRVLLDEERLATSAANLLQDKIRRTIGTAMDERIGRNLLLGKLDGKPLEYSISRSAFGAYSFEILATRTGVISEVYLDRLFDFAKELETAANQSGYSFEEQQSTEGLKPQQDQNMAPVTERKLVQERRRYILKLFGDQVTDRSNCLLSFPRSLVQDPVKRQELAKSGRSAFVIKSGDTYSDRVERYLGLMKDEAIGAIKDRRTAYLQNLLNAFEKVAITFADEMKRAIGGHSFQSAMNERQTLFGGWNEMKWISRHLFEIHYRGCRSDDLHVARIVATAPLAVAYRLVSQRDSLVFDQFTAFFHSLYSAVDDVTNLKIKQLLVELCSQFAIDIGFGIAMELERPENAPEDLERIQSFATILIVRYVELLKLSFDRRKVSDFQTFKHAMNELLDHLSSRLIRPGTALRTTEVTGTQLAEDQASIAREQTRQKALVGVLKAVHRQKQQAHFAIGSYIFSVAASSSEPVANYLQEVDTLLSTLNDRLPELYVSMQDPEGQQMWTRAFYQDAPEGMWNQSAGTEYFSYLLLKSTFEHGDGQFLAAELPNEPSFVSEIGNQGQISTLLTHFQEDREKWSKLVPDTWLAAIPKLQQVFSQLTADRTKAEEDAIIRSPIDEEYVRKFRERFVQEFEKNAILRCIFNKFGAYSDESQMDSPATASPKWGVNLLDLRQAYTSKDHTMYAQWPEEYARKLATSESETAFRQMMRQLQELDLSGIQDPEAQITAIIQELQKRNIRPDAFLVPWQSALGNGTLELKGFTPRWVLPDANEEIWGFLGRIAVGDRQVPVYAVSTNAGDASVGGVVALQSSFRWIQRPPTDNAEERKDRQKYFHIPIVDLDRRPEMRKKILADNPLWLQAQTDKERYLSLRVWLRISERFEIQPRVPNLGFKFKLA